jgi:hypothetical protein
MRRLHLWVALLTMAAGGVAVAHASPGPDEGPPTYTNARVVAVDAIGRTLVIRNARGAEEKVVLDDNLAGFEDIRAGDRVSLTLRAGPGWARVTSIIKATPESKAAASPSPSPVAPRADAEARASREAFVAQVARVAGQADGADRVFNEFRRACDFQATNPHEGARAWFAIWEGSIRADLSGGFCRDLFNQIIDLGEPVKAGMAAAEEVARRSLSPGEIREVRRQYRMDWDGWALTAPKRLEQ